MSTRGARSRSLGATSTGKGVSAAAWAIVDQCGTVLAHSNGHDPRHPASLTKLATGLVLMNVIQNYNFGAIEAFVEVTTAASALRGTSASLIAGDRLTPTQALHALLLPSGNDAAASIQSSCVTLECTHGSSPHPPRPFLGRMAAAACQARGRGRGGRRRPAALDTKHPTPAHSHTACCSAPSTHCFANAHGLDAAGHRMSPIAAARLGAAALQHCGTAQAMCTAEYTTTVHSCIGADSRVLTWRNTHEWVAKYGLMGSDKTASKPAKDQTCDGMCEPSTSIGSSGGSSLCGSNSGSCAEEHEEGGDPGEAWRGVPMAGQWRLLGGKTGFTRGAGYCLFTGLQAKQWQLHIAVLGSRSKGARYTDTLRLARQAQLAGLA